MQTIVKTKTEMEVCGETSTIPHLLLTIANNYISDFAFIWGANSGSFLSLAQEMWWLDFLTDVLPPIFAIVSIRKRFQAYLDYFMQIFNEGIEASMRINIKRAFSCT